MRKFPIKYFIKGSPSYLEIDILRKPDIQEALRKSCALLAQYEAVSLLFGVTAE